MCGKSFTATTKTAEHVFPHWLLKRFNFWNHKLVLLNGTEIPYRQVRIPCCQTCNNEDLAQLEERIESASQKGYDSFRRLPRRVLFIWLSKIMYELLYMELHLRADRTKPHKGGIVRRKMFTQYRTLHLFLQAAKVKTVFHKPYPWSIFLFRVQQYHDVHRNFDFKDHPLFVTIAIRMGDIGIIACLEDNGAQAHALGRIVAKIRKLQLHPVQFTELIAKHFYKASLLNRVPKYLSMKTKGELQVVSMPIQGQSNKPVFDDWNPRDYARMLSHYLQIRIDQILAPDGQVMTWLYNDEGKLKFMDVKKYDIDVT